MDFIERIKNGDVLVSDGATGTNLQQRGLARGEATESWVLNRPQEILALAQSFVAAGSDLILTCTFGATSIRLQAANLQDHVEAINLRAVEIARQAMSPSKGFVAGSIGPTGQMLQPYGTLSYEEAFAAYKQQAALLAQAGVDLLVIETQFDINEAKAAVMAVRSVSDLPLVCSVSFDRGKRTMMGVSPAQVAQEIGALAVDLLGINCGRSLEDNLAALKLLRAETDKPLWFKPNAGLPKLDDSGQPVYDVTPSDMAEQVPAWLAAGAQVVGGCCGTSPAHLAAIVNSVKPVKVNR